MKNNESLVIPENTYHFGNLKITYEPDDTIHIGDEIILAEFEPLRKDLVIANLYITDADGAVVDCSIVVDFKDKPEIKWVGDAENFFLAINSVDEDYSEDFEKVVIEVMKTELVKTIKHT